MTAAESALALDSAETLALIGMGGIRSQQQRWPDSIQYLEKSRTADPDALLLLCDSYYRVGKPDEALLTAEVIRALGTERKELLDRLQQLVALHQTDVLLVRGPSLAGWANSPHSCAMATDRDVVKPKFVPSQVEHGLIESQDSFIRDSGTRRYVLAQPVKLRCVILRFG